MPLTAQHILNHVLDQCPWVNRANTVDTVKHGDAGKPLHRIGVCWYPSLWTLRQAAELGCDGLVTHEPLWWDHWERGGWQEKPLAQGRLKVLEESGMVVLRLHDSWDAWPGLGIRDCFARGLGLTELLAESSDGWHAMYRITPQPLRSLAEYVAAKVRPLGEDSVAVLGDPAQIVSRPSIGVGCYGPHEDMIAQGSDGLILTYDGASYWRDRQRLAEQGVGVIMLEHGTTEMWGIESLAGYLRQAFAGLDVRYLAGHERAWHVWG